MLSCYYIEKSGKKQEENTENKVNSVEYNKVDGLLYSSVSAQDLRCLDMEKERHDMSSPRGVLEACIRSLDLETSSSKDSPRDADSPRDSRAVSHWRGFFNQWKRKSVRRFASFPPLSVPKIPRKKSTSMKENEHPVLDSALGSNLYNWKYSWRNFTLSELQTATHNFSHENLIGKGGYAEVYKGCLEDGQLVAVKRVVRGETEERTAGFLSELGVIAHVNHPNTAKLIGYGVEGGLYLVLQLSPLGSLGSLLHGAKEKLDWSIRHKIALGTADGLHYLHESCQRRIIHRDIKADNILLTENYEPQICDFGLAKWLPKQWTHRNVSKFEGTFGYFAPEYFMHGIVDVKTDVYAFGVLLLELITGRRALDDSQQSLVIWAKPLLDGDQIGELVDPSLADAYNLEEMDRVVLTASLCIEQSPILRPPMSQVVILLRGDEYSSQIAEESKTPSLQRIYSKELMDAEENNSIKHLNEVGEHRKIAFDC